MAYHEFDWDIMSYLALFNLVYKAPTNSLNENENVYGQPNAMMRVRETATWANSKVSEDEDDSRQYDRKDLKRDVYAKG